MHTYEVRVCVEGRWITECRCFEKSDAIQKGKLIATDRSLDGVKVIEEVFDEETGLFKEHTLFSYINQEKRAAKAASSKSFFFAPPINRKPGSGRVQPRSRAKSHDGRAWMLLMALVFSLGANLGLGLFLSDGWKENLKFAVRFLKADGEGAKPAVQKGDKLVIYDLPTVTMSYGTAEDSRTIRVKLGIELTDRRHIKNIEARLSEIIASVANDLSAVANVDLHQRKGLMGLRKSLHSGVQTAAGGIPVRGVLFKEILVF